MPVITPTNYQIPVATELARVEQVLLPRFVNNIPFMKHFPFTFKRETVLRWTQRDNYRGLMAVRGLGGKPGRVSLVDDSVYLCDPGYYGDHVELDERDLTIRRDAATLSGGPIPLGDLVAEAQEILLTRRINRQAWIMAQLLLNGTFSVVSKSGAVLHTDSYTQQVLTAAVKWNDHVNSVPLQDLRQLPIIVRGQSVNMGPAASIYLNQVTVNHLLANNNPADLGGKKVEYGNSILTLGTINKILEGEGLPKIEVVEDGYDDDTGVFQLFVPDGAGVAVGMRTSGVAIGEFRYTLNQQAPSGSGVYTRVIDLGSIQIPGSVQVHDGFNGGITLQFPGTIVKLANLIA